MQCVGISADGRTAVSGSDDRTVRVWDLETRTAVCEPLLGHAFFVKYVAISANGRTVVSTCPGSTIRIWNRSESELQWKCSYTCLLPVAWKGVLAYRDDSLTAEDDSSGVIGKLYCPIRRGGASRAVFELVRPG